MSSSSRIATLQTLLRTGCPSNDPEYRVALSNLNGELVARFRRDAHSNSAREYAASALQVLAHIKGAANAHLRADMLLECYKFFYISGNYDLALAAANAMEEAANFAQSTHMVCRAEMSAGILHAEHFRIGDALLKYSRVIDIAARHGHHFSHTAAWLNLGNALNYGSLYRDAIPCFQRCQELALSDPSTAALEPSALCNIAQSHYSLEEYEQGLAAIERCFEVSTAPSSPAEMHQRIIREMTFVFLACALNRRAYAALHSDQCGRFANALGTDKAKFFAALAIGCYEVRFTNADAGLRRLEAALNSSVAAVPILRTDALAVLVRAYDECGKPREALKCLNRLIELVRESRKSGLLHLSAIQISQKRPWADRQDLRSLEAMQTRISLEIAQDELVEARIEMLERLAIAADLKEEQSGQHGYRVGALSALIARELGWNPAEIHCLELGARLHDLGKTAVPDRILLSNTALREADRQFVNAHTRVGAELLSGSSIPQLQRAEAIARSHHEWWNGEGYPSKLSGNRIPIHARIVALADVFDALTHGRPYAPAWPVEKALAEIRSRRGTQFDPELTDVFLNLMERLISEHEDLDAYLGQASRHSPFLQARNKIRQMLEAERENEKRATVDGNQTRH